MSHKIKNNIPTGEISQSLYVLKALAIVCVAAAHCGSFAYPLAETIRGLIATLGVPVFFICSGFFFNREEYAWKFWSKKLKGIVIPWILWGALTYVLISFLGHTAMNWEAGIRWIVGYKTWLYFVPALIVSFAIFRMVKTNWWIYLNIAISVVSWALTYAGVIQVTKYLTLYQNPLNYTMFFALGMLLRKRDLTEIAEVRLWAKIAVLAAFLCVGAFYWMTGNIGYWGNLLSIPFELLGVFLLFIAAYALRKSTLLIQVGKTTYFIYFAHMIIGSGIANAILWNHLPAELGAMECLVVFVKPALTVLICFVMCVIIRWVAKVIPLEKLLWIIGM